MHTPQISGQEMSRILAGYDPKDIDDDPYHTGTTVNGEKYHTLSAQGRLRIGRKVFILLFYFPYFLLLPTERTER